LPVSLPDFVLHHPRLPWLLDASLMGLDAERLDALQWPEALSAMSALEQGAIANPDEQRQVGHYWLRAPELAPSLAQGQAIGETQEAVCAFAERVRSGQVLTAAGLPFTDVLQVGIGGSALGPQLLIDALAPVNGGLAVHFADNTDPDGLGRLLNGLGDRLRRTLVLVVSKSGGTAETRNGQLLVCEALSRAGVQPAAHLVAITGAGSNLDRTAKADRWLATFPMWDWVGGRTSVTSAVGTLVAELAGLDTTALLQGARDMDAWTRDGDWRTNPAALLAGAWHVAGKGVGDRAMVALPYSDRLVLFSRYLQQLIMESIGKEHDLEGKVVHQGLTVYGNKGSTDQHAYVQQLRDGRDDFFVTFIAVLGDGVGSDLQVADGANAGDFLQGFLLGTRRALNAAGRPSLTLTVPEVSPYVLGGLIALFERAVGLYASLIGVNAYHQPGVEAGKKAAADVLELSRDLRAVLATGPATLTTLVQATGADLLELGYLAERLVRTERLVRDGAFPGGTYRLRKGSDA